MTSLAEGVLQIAGTGHVYYAEPDTPVPSLRGYRFGDGTTMEGDGWYWMGDTSSENLVEFENDGGDVTTKDTWDRKAVRSSREEVKNSMTINAVNINRELIELAFPGSVYHEESESISINLSGSIEKAILIVIEDGDLVSAMEFRRVTIAGNMPALNKEEFTEVKISGTLLSPLSGKTRVEFHLPVTVTGVGSVKPSITTVTPAAAKVGAKVTIEGTNFDGVRKVTVNGVKANFTKVSSTKITFFVPKGAATGNIVVTNNIGDSDGKSFTVSV